MSNAIVVLFVIGLAGAGVALLASWQTAKCKIHNQRRDS